MICHVTANQQAVPHLMAWYCPLQSTAFKNNTQTN
jgi:hypothetical protein